MYHNYLKVRVMVMLILLCSITAIKANAQECGADAAQQRLWQQYPQFAQKEHAATLKWAQYMNLINSALIINTPQGPVYQIPVVIHVMHTGGAVGSIYNPTDAALTGMIDYLNQTYAAIYSSYPDTNNGGVRLPIQFILAKRDPSCNSSTGIVRVNASALPNYSSRGVNASNTNGVTDSAVKSLSLWSTYDYLNIWVVNRIDGADGTSGTFTAGFAYMPPVFAYVDGVVMLATQAQSGKITLPHEVGHYLGLYHTFEGGSTTVCPTNTTCATDGDQVCDTQPEKQSNFNCPADPNPCTGTSYNFVQHNFMDYSNCQDRFTAGQRTRMVYKLMNLRPGLLSSLGGVAPGTSSVTAASCTPGIVNAGNQGDMGVAQVVLNDLQANSGGYNDDGNVSYRDNTCLQRANLVTGQSYTLSVTTGPANAQNVKAWIDFNNDGVFQAGELVLTGPSIAASGVATATVAIPATGYTTCTPLRMRVMSDFASVAAPSSCTNVQYGQTEDFTVYITNPDSASIALTTGSNPGCVSTSRTFTASSYNLGTAPVYNWYVNNVLVSSNATTYTTSSLNNGDSIRVRAYATTTGCRTADTVYSRAIYLSLTSTISAPTAGSNSPVCVGNTLNLTASTITGATYAWTGPNSFTSNVQNPTILTPSVASSGTYTVVATLGACTSPAATTTVVVNGAPVTLVAGSNSPICTGSTLNLTAGTLTAASYSWTGPNGFTSTAQNPSITNVHVLNSGTYTVTATVPGCSFAPSTPVSVTIDSTPVAPTATATNFCTGGTINLTANSATSGVTYAWTGPNSFTSSTQNPTITAATSVNAGTYSVVAHLGICASTAGTASATLASTPAAPTPTSNSPVCAGGTLNLFASTVTGVTYNWSGPNSYTSTTQNPSITGVLTSAAGQYMVYASVGTCTSAHNAVSVVVNPSPAAPTAGSNSPLCAGSALNLTATTVTGATYSWTGPGSYTSTAQNPTIASAAVANGGTYSVTATAGGCTSPAGNTTVVVNADVTPTITISPVTPVAGNSTNFKTTFTNGGTAPTFIWTKNGAALTSSVDSINSITLVAGDTICVVINSNAACATPATATACTYATTGVANINSPFGDVQLYPNPNDGMFTITGTITGNKNVGIEVLNVLGQVVYKDAATVNANKFNKQIDLNHMSSGLYLLKVTTADSSKTIKFSIQ